MASYYGSGYSDQQSGNGGSGFYAGSQRQQQQPNPPPQQAFQQNHYGGGNTQQWTDPQPQQQSGQQSSSNNTPQQQQAFWNPAAAASVMSMAAGSGFSNDTMLELASNAGKSFFQSGSARMIPGLETTMGKLRVYFAVDNRYVKRKMQKVLFPFLSKHWKREVRLCFPRMFLHIQQTPTLTVRLSPFCIAQ
jgi:hypothetical protein